MQSAIDYERRLCRLNISRAEEAYCGLCSARMRSYNLVQHFTKKHKWLVKPWAVTSPRLTYYAYRGWDLLCKRTNQDTYA